MHQFRYKFVRTLSPALSVGMLLWAAHVTHGWPAQADAKPYHARALMAVNSIPLEVGRWVGREVKPQSAAIEMLRPNAIRTIEFTDPSAGALRGPERKVWLNIVQCRNAGDMLGHYPSRCYPSYGDVALGSRHRVWSIPAKGETTQVQKPMELQGTEYRFERVVDGMSFRRTVYNFMVAPGKGIAAEQKELEEAAEDYRRRYYGAAQVQVVFASLAGQEPSESERDEVFSTLMQASRPAIEVLRSVE